MPHLLWHGHPFIIVIPEDRWHSHLLPNAITTCFSSPEPKAQMSFSDQNLSVVRRRRSRCRRCRCHRKLFTFSSSSPEPLGQFKPNLAQSILGWRGFKFVQIEEPINSHDGFSLPEPKAQVSFSNQNLSVIRRCHRKLFTFSSSSPEPLDQFQLNLAQSILG